METYEIKWTSRAIKDLRKVYNFYMEFTGDTKAFELILKILERVDFLSDKRFVEMGAIDEEFRHLERKYKKLIEGDIKITYRLSTTGSVVYINRVFDTRQHPNKNK